MRRRPPPKSHPVTLSLVAVAVCVLVLSVAAPIVPGAGNSTGILMLSALTALALTAAPSRVGWLLVLVSLGIAAGAGAGRDGPPDPGTNACGAILPIV